jgi:hypothetical protein
MGYSDKCWMAAQRAPIGRATSTIVLDASGTIVSCDAAAAQLFFATPQVLAGHHIKRLIPDLPLKSSTPDFNAAYAAFCASHPVWAAYRALDALGCATRVYVSFELPETGAPDAVLLHVRHEAEQDDEERLAVHGAARERGATGAYAAS